MTQDEYEIWYKNSGIPEARKKAAAWTKEDEDALRKQREEADRQARMPSNWRTK